MKHLLCLIFGLSILSNSIFTLDIIVIGAGAAGIAAANEAVRLGFKKVTVLEGRNRIGGRVFSDMTFGYAVDLGAAWIHGISGNQVYDVATKNNVKTVIFDYENVKYYSNFVSSQQLQNMASLFTTSSNNFFTFLETKRQQGADVSLASVVNEYYNTKNIDSTTKGILNNWIFSEIEIEYGTTINNLSRDNFDSGKSFKGEDVLMPDGYVEIFKAISKNLDIKFNQIITNIDQSSSSKKVKIMTKTNESYEADYVVVTVPLGCLKKNTIKFTPELSDAKKLAIQKLEFGTIDKVVIEFTEKFWDDNNIIRIVNSPLSPFNFVVNFGRIVNKNTLIFLIGGNGNYYNLNNTSNDKIRDDVVNLLKTIYPTKNVQAKNVLVTRWALDEFAYGAYTSFGIGSSRANNLEFSNPEGRVYFAGEHTSKEFVQTVHGAYGSGIAAIQSLPERETSSSYFNRFSVLSVLSLLVLVLLD